MSRPPARLPQVSGHDCRRVLERVGFVFRRQSGSHMILSRDGQMVSVPDHRTLAPGTLRAIIREAGLTVAEFVDLL